MSDFLFHLCKALTPSRLKTLLLSLSLLFNLYLLLHYPLPLPAALLPFQHLSLPPPPFPTDLGHLLFSVASSADSLPRRAPLIRLWFRANATRALVFLDRPTTAPADSSLPPVVVSADTSQFPYTYPRGLRSAIRVARIVKEAVDRRDPGVRWFVFGDDDTVFFTENLVKVLSKYDHERWYYIGCNSESYGQNMKHSFHMAFGGGGFAISRSLAVVLAGVLDSCIMRYPHLYGSDLRIFSCLAELGVGLTHEPGFHQFDVRGSLFGLLSAHSLSPLLSLHHLANVEPIFPNMNTTQALEHLFEAVSVDSARILQQTVCYDHSNSLTVSVAWGYAVQVYRDNKLLPDLLQMQGTFTPWRRKYSQYSALYMFNTREYPKDPCKRPATFYLENVTSDNNGVWSNYARQGVRSCKEVSSLQHLEKIRVFAPKLELDVEQLKAPRRQCCDILYSPKNSIFIDIRKCGLDELISMNS